jgi:methyl-accepting chemotaxis protein
MAVLTNLRIGPRLMMLVMLLSALLVVIGVKGLVSMGSIAEGLRTVYEDRAVPLVQLADLQDALHRVRTNATVAAANASESEVDRLIASTAELDARFDKVWAEYMAT